MTAVDMTTSLGKVDIPSPVLTASGCSSFGRELEPFVDLAAIGAVVT
jgi:dihydroorotate dehydrogenase (NAD+) catalytic subunit